MLPSRPTLRQVCGELAYPITDQVTRAAILLRRRRNARRCEQTAEEIMATWDQARFDDLYRKHWNYFQRTHDSKFLDARHWVRDSVDRYYLYGLDTLAPGCRVLDIGCGAGYFLAVARHFGHHVVGLDVPDNDIFNDVIDYFGIDRFEHRIESGVPLPELGQQFDVATAFMTSFNKLPGGNPWDAPDWLFFLNDLRQYLVDGGMVVIKFNVNHRIRRYYPPTAKRAMLAMAAYHVRFFRDSIRLIAR